MTGYTKLFGSIVASTIWSEDDQTRIVWITMLAMANQHGEVQASVPGLAKFAQVSLKATEAALKKLSAPDAYSRTKDFEGRRIEAIDGGWVILNHGKYRQKASVDDRREQAKLRAKRFRERNARVTQSNAASRTVTQSHAKQTQTQIAETEVPPVSPGTPSSGPTEANQSAGGGKQDRGQTEPHPSFPKTAEEANGASFVIGCPREFAVKSWDKARSRGGRDAKDIPIRDWSAYLATEWRYEQERTARHGGRHGGREAVVPNHTKGF